MSLRSRASLEGKEQRAMTLRIPKPTLASPSPPAYSPQCVPALECGGAPGGWAHNGLWGE